MNIKEIKIWLVENNLDDNELFSESLKCYSVDAIKAAYLYSYLAFLDYIKKIVLEYKYVPKSYKDKFKENSENKWKEKIKKLYSDDMWEEEVLNFINEGNETNVFRLKDDIRREFLSTKVKRNTCAHNKNRSITSTTFEDLWDFIAYSKPYFVVNGPVELLKEDLDKILIYLTAEEYNKKIKDIYDNYLKLKKEDRKEYFYWLLDLIKEKMEDFDIGDKLERICTLINYIFEKKNAEEYEWIKSKDILFDIYLYLIVENYDKLCNKKEDLSKYTYKEIDKISNFINLSENINKITEFIILIYTEDKFIEWWDYLDKLLIYKKNFVLTDEIKDILLIPDSKNKLLEDITSLFMEDYPSQLSYPFSYWEEYKYRNKLKNVLLLAKEKNIEDERITDLKKRCKTILDRYESKQYKEYIAHNYKYILNLFKEHPDLSQWVKE